MTPYSCCCCRWLADSNVRMRPGGVRVGVGRPCRCCLTLNRKPTSGSQVTNVTLPSRCTRCSRKPQDTILYRGSLEMFRHPKRMKPGICMRRWRVGERGEGD